MQLGKRETRLLRFQDTNTVTIEKFAPYKFTQFSWMCIYLWKLTHPHEPLPYSLYLYLYVYLQKFILLNLVTIYDSHKFHKFIPTNFLRLWQLPQKYIYPRLLLLIILVPYVTVYAKRDHVPELVIFSSKPKFLNNLYFVNSEISRFS